MRIGAPRPLPLILRDTREPHPHVRSVVEVEGVNGVMVERCEVCGGRRECEAPFTPFIVRNNERIDLPVARVTLAEGDYSLPGFARSREGSEEWSGERWAVIERKSLTDAISTVVGSTVDALGERADNRERFAEELARMRAYHFRTIVIEATPGDVQREAENPRRRFSAASVLGSYAAFAVRFGIQVWWAGSRVGAEWYVGTVLARMWEEHTGGPAQKKAQARGDAMPWIGGS